MEGHDSPKILPCPQDKLALRSLSHAGVRIDYCLECRGLWFDRDELEHIADVDAAWLREHPGNSRATKRPCPRGHGPMREQEITPGSGALLDWCQQCGGVWLDRGELQRLRARALRVPAASAQRVEALEARVDEAQRQWDEAKAAVQERQVKSGPGQWWFQWLAGLPVEVYSPVRSRPLATYMVIALTLAVFILQWSSPDMLITMALVPSVFLQGRDLWTLLTAMFLHGGFLHVAGNMYFLGVFGDNVEDRLGWRQYLTLYLVGGAVASLVHIASDPASTLPVIGASGAVSAIMGAYAYLFPERRIYMLVFFRLLRVRAIWYLGIYLLLQFVYAAMGISGVAWWAHIGGFAAGLVWAVIHRAQMRRRLETLEKAFG